MVRHTLKILQQVGHLGTLCNKWLKAVIAGNSLILRDLIEFCISFLLQSTPNLPTTLSLEILPTHFVKYNDKFQKSVCMCGWAGGYTPHTSLSARPCSWFKVNNFRVTLVMVLKFYTSVAKRLKLKVRKFLELFPTFVEVTGEKLVRGAFLPPLPDLE